MRKNNSYIAFDLGAESGRVISGRFDGERLALEEIHRFPTGPVRIGNSLFWDVMRFWSEIRTGLAMAACLENASLASLGVDTWGVDFALLDAQDGLIGNPYHYRDSRTNGMLQVAFRKISKNKLYEQTGNQFLELNTLFQLLSMVEAGSPAIQSARTFLMVPDLFNFWLCGRKVNEFTNTTTTQCYNPRKAGWAVDVLDLFGIQSGMFGEVVQPSTQLAPLHSWVANGARCRAVPVVAVASHDTASAIAAIPAEGQDWIFISSGTWSLMGVVLEQPRINSEALAYDFTNEGGLNGNYSYLKNITGLWLLQECRRQWEHAGRKLSYDDLTQLADRAPALESLIDPSDPRFIASGDMIPRIQAFCAETGQSIPQTQGEIVRCILQSIAMEYCWVAAKLQDQFNRRFPLIHIIGGGSRNSLLNQFTANATGCKVVAGPVEATALGNILSQALALGDIASFREGWDLVRKSFQLTVYEAKDRSQWDESYQRCYLPLKTRQ